MLQNAEGIHRWLTYEHEGNERFSTIRSTTQAASSYRYTRAMEKGLTGRNSAVGLALREVVASLWRLRCRCCGSNASSGSALVPDDALKRLLRPCCSPEPGAKIGMQLTLGLFSSRGNTSGLEDIRISGANQACRAVSYKARQMPCGPSKSCQAGRGS